MSGMPRTRTCLAVATLAMGLLAGCSSSGGSEEPIDTGDTPANDQVHEEASDTAADEAALKQLFLDYWNTIVELENSEEIDRTAFDGIANYAVSEQQVSRVQQLKDMGVHRQGEPDISGIKVEVEGDEATIQGCVNSDEWLLYDENGKEVPVEQGENSDAKLVTAEKSSDGWLITANPTEAETTISC